MLFHQFPSAAPERLWRVCSLRRFGSRQVRMVDWFASEGEARKKAEATLSLGGSLLSFTCYHKQSQERRYE